METPKLPPYFSQYIEIALLKGTSADEVIRHTKSTFVRQGIPELVISDMVHNSVQNHTLSLQRSTILNVTSSPYHPQGNGETERTVGTVKKTC